MDDGRKPDFDHFRAELRDWLAGVKRPLALRDYGATPTAEDVPAGRAWQRLLAESGWACISWPVECGGRGASPMEQAIFAEELAHAGLPRQLNIVGPDLVGPMVIAFGRPDQHRSFLAPIRLGEHLWCQLFSEPGAGSDLAALRTRAEPVPDGWVIRGQKVWTSAANSADMGLLLARTEPDPGHGGLSCFLLPMDRSGISVRPLRQMDGETKFNEVFFDGVGVGHDDLLGAPGEGWRVAVSTLGSERLALGSQAVSLFHAFERIRVTLAEEDNAMTAAASERLAGVWTRIWLLRTTWLRALSSDRGLADPALSILKLVASELQRDLARLGVDLIGARAIVGDSRTEHAARLLASPGATIAGGTSEIQRDILAERVLGLPRSR